ncbi:unnamed protein product, partial [Didymodactylos carnosus]
FSLLTYIAIGKYTSLDECPLPKQLKTNYDFDYTQQRGEEQNSESGTYFFRLALSWSPSFCEGILNEQRRKDLFQCQHNFGLIVHGLWPQARNAGNKVSRHPRNCRNDPQIDPKTIQEYFCMMPSETLMQAEYEKHGSCYWSSAEHYFHRAKTLFQNLRQPENMEQLANPAGATKAIIKQAFMSINPGLKQQ